MSIEIIIRCDARGCCNEREIATSLDYDLERAGYHEHEGFHYCSKCWPKVEKEIAKHSEEDNEE